jgi:uncharacterized protein (TIGR03067 family)
MRRAAAAVALAALGLVAGAAPRRASAEPALDGAWTVAQATMNGEVRADRKVLNATWTFRGAELVVRNLRGERLRAALSFDAAARPPAFHVTPLDASGEKPLWIIWTRWNDELRLAFYDGLDRRPEDFGPRRKLVVLTLVPAPAAPVSLDPCAILRKTGADRVLRGPTRARPAPHVSAPGPTCALGRTDGSSAVSLTLVAAPGGAAFVDAARREADADRHLQIEEEPTLGAGAFSGSGGWTVIVVALKSGTAMVLRVEGVGVDREALRRFAARVLDAL